MVFSRRKLPKLVIQHREVSSESTYIQLTCRPSRLYLYTVCVSVLTIKVKQTMIWEREQESAWKERKGKLWHNYTIISKYKNYY